MRAVYFFSLALILSTSQHASAQEVGIEFAKMKVGTTLITESIESPKRRLEQKYVGKQDAWFVLEERQSKNGSAMESLGKVFYDHLGRRVKSERKRGITYHRPYSCMYATGTCTHEVDYPNPFTKKAEKRTKSKSSYKNRLEGDKLFVTWELANGSRQEVPYTLGPYRLRVASEYKNALGQLRGHTLVEVIEP